MSKLNRFRRSNTLSITTEQSGRHDRPELLLVEPRSTRSFEVSSVALLRCLADVDESASRSEIESRLRTGLDVSGEEATALFETLVEGGVLRSAADSNGNTGHWRRNEWQDALEYHEHVRDYPFIDDVVAETEYDSREEMEDTLMKEYSEREEVPPVYKEYDVDDRIELPSQEETPSFAVSDALETSLFATPDSEASPLDARRLSSVLYAAFGETGEKHFPHQGRKLRKMVPSGGARHPTEGYVAVFESEDVPSGFYHYSVRDHALERVSDETDPDKPRIAGVDFDPACLIGCTAMVERSMWRYREPRTYRVLYHDVGHVLEMLRLVARAHGFSTMSRSKFDDQVMESFFDVDYAEEPVLAYIALAAGNS